MRRVLAAWILVAACREPHDEPPAPAPTVVAAIVHADAAVAVAVAIDAPIDAAVAPIDAGPPPPSALEARLRGYAKLLAIDFAIYQIIAAYPGAPTGTTFASVDYQWRVVRGELAAMTAALDAIVTSEASASPVVTVDTQVRPYAEALAAWLPKLTSLVAYYDDERYVDDEFDRGRREAPDVAKAAAELARLRRAMRPAVYAAWHDLVADQPLGARAVVGHAWEACMSIADRVMEGAKPDVIDRQLSACRRSIPAVTAVDDANHRPDAPRFDEAVRKTALAFGDWLAQNRPTWQMLPGEALGTLTDDYFAAWSQLPGGIAERP